MTMDTDKSALRAELRARRDGFATDKEAAFVMPGWLRARIAPGTVVASYWAVGSEADPSGIERDARMLGAAIALPHVAASRAVPMRFLAWSPGQPLVDGPMRLKQPAASATELVPDIILTPLIGFDDALNRLGQGAAYYDRAFARFPDALRIGVAWSVQEVPAVPVDPWDVPLHAVITERGLFMTGDW
ncbi:MULTISPECIES: 5-formyltetrahydrofolate cyclo-ligase [unclassified Sphingomonas]|uniref:5-formyltetrahydrofolate cyclo-ligase n=1 Tax=unclassified Sphingomonas TaxID=196159 RepID=UPI00082E4EB2|nr:MULTISPECIES: 5-formyltetrahydrofolate cyclo-ligase [unclassified Sphingomonas]